MRPRKDNSFKKNKNTRLNPSKYFFVLSVLAVVILLAAGLRFFFAPYVTDSNELQTSELQEEKAKGVLNKSGKQDYNNEPEVEFTFFDTLTQSEKNTLARKDLKQAATAKPVQKKRAKTTRNIEKKAELKKIRITSNTSSAEHNKKANFILQLGSFKEMSRAETFAIKLNKKGYPTEIKSAKVPGKGTWYRVFFRGGFKSREKAVNMIEKMKRVGLSALLKKAEKK